MINKKLTNTKDDLLYLYNILASGDTPEAIIKMGIFENQLASGFKIIDFYGFIKKIDMESGYCEWVNENGIQMPCVNINAVTLLIDDKLDELSNIFGTVVVLE